ncbi:hypothetical protein JXVLWARM_CDS_0081 [Burkholderia phage Bm1]
MHLFTILIIWWGVFFRPRHERNTDCQCDLCKGRG